MNEQTALTPEQIAAAKAEEAAKKAALKAEEKTKRDAAAAEKKAAKEQEKAEAKAKREADKAAKVQAKIDAKAAAVAAKEASKMPEQNGVRRPKTNTTCGRCWAVYDDLSNKRGQPVAIADAKKVLESEGVNEATMRTQYAHWRKFNGVTGRVGPEKAETPPAAPEAAPAQ